MNPEVSIILLMKNEADFLDETLRSVFAQKTDRPFEVIAVDSGSRDRTVEIARLFEKVRLIEIEPSEFGHGKTRNFAAQLARGRFLVFSNGHATPADENWLEELIKPLAVDENVAGTFNMHLPRPDCIPIVKRDMETSQLFVDKKDRWVTLEKIPGFEGLPLGQRKDLYTFTTIGCAIRGSVFREHPFKEIEFGEDLEWGKRILETGYTIVACFKSRVYHSHQYGIVEWFMRNFDDSCFVTSMHLSAFAEKKSRILSYLYRAQRSDVGYVLRLKKSFLYKLTWFGLIPLYRISAALAFLLGCYHERLPSWLTSRISLVERIKQS